MSVRYVINLDPIDLEQVDLPPHAEVRDSHLGYGAKILCVVAGSAKPNTNDGVEAIRAAYPNIKVTAVRELAVSILDELQQESK